MDDMGHDATMNKDNYQCPRWVLRTSRLWASYCWILFMKAGPNYYLLMVVPFCA